MVAGELFPLERRPKRGIYSVSNIPSQMEREVMTVL